MTNKEKKLLLKDLCARLPYNFTYCYCNAPLTEGRPLILTPVVISNLMNATDDLVLKPYLRPMSSMTKEEYNEMQAILGEMEDAVLMNKTSGLELWLESIDTDHTIWFYSLVEVQDWLNAHHFDYRGLIEMGLALEAPEGMYNTKQ